MAEQITLANLSSLENETSAINVINNNSSVIVTAFTDCLSLSGVSPNSMNANLDMNNNQILNLPSPASTTSPVRLIDVAGNPTITVPPVGTSGGTVPLLSGNNTFSGTTTFTNTVTVPNSTITGAKIASGTITGSNLANNTVSNSQIRQSSGLSVVGNTGSSTANVADITGTTRQVLAVNTGGTGLVFAQPRGDQLLGTATNDSATAGNVGEYVSAALLSGSAISLTNSTFVALTSISLTPGDWDVAGQIVYVPAGTTTVTLFDGNIYTTAASNNLVLGQFASRTFASSAPGGNAATLELPRFRWSLSSTTTLYLNALSNFATSTMTAYGIIWARRIR